MSRARLTVVGVGGNAVNPAGGDASLAAERAAIETAVDELAALASESSRLLVVHGNGPQVGRLLAAPGVGDPAHLDIHVAQTQGELGYLLADGLQRAISRPCAALVTRVVVDPDDPAFEQPIKPIGPVLDRRPDAVASNTTPDGRGWRRVVASPRPQRVVEQDAIATLLATHDVVAGGGGGIPITFTDGETHGVPAVIDKDWVAALLAIALGADRLISITDVESAFDRFAEAGRTPLRTLTNREARRLLERGEFAPGSMAPKIESAVEFVEETGHDALIAKLGEVAAALRGESGTTVRRAP